MKINNVKDEVKTQIHKKNKELNQVLSDWLR